MWYVNETANFSVCLDNLRIIGIQSNGASFYIEMTFSDGYRYNSPIKSYDIIRTAFTELSKILKEKPSDEALWKK